MKQHIKNNTKFNKNNKNFNNKSFSNKKLFKPKIYKEKPKQSVQEDIEIKDLQSKYDSIDPKCINLFSDFPLSKKTQKGLKQCDYKIPTDIQKESIGYALKGNDVLGAAITGSGKTLAFLIPIMETLFTKKWSRVDGVGAIIISPTRELAYQIFETLRKIGNEHDFSAGLIIGGKNLKYERRRMDQCNIVICTPGRLLQHMDENPLFNCSTMQILVLDEADRCLDMGFSETMNGIIENLPPERQTLLFSATQTNSVKDLARLSLKNPIYVAPHEQSEFSTPVKLQQNYVIVNLEDKVTMLWSFLKNHLKQKCIIFLASCKQVKYIYEIFCKLRPGISLLALYGTLHQERRMAIYNEFCRKSNVVLFATDIASRGLDFPTVNWVIQFDCPEDATAYIHRAGRTARHQENGENLLILMPNEEEPMVKELKERKIPIEKIFIDSKRLFSPKAKIEAFLAQNQQLKESAQRAFVAYIKSIVLMKNKQCFNVKALDLDAYARSLGLIVTPRIRFLQRLKKAQQKNYLKQTGANNKEGKDDDDDDDNDSGDNDDKEDVSDEHKNNKLPNEYINFNNETSSDDENDDLITIKRRNHDILEEQLPEVPQLNEIKTAKKSKKPLTKAAIAKRILKKKITVNKRIIYNDDGEVIIDTAKQLQSELAKEYDQSTEGGINIEKAKELLREEDKFDKKRFQQLVKAKHKEMKKKAKSQSNKQDEFDEFGSDADNGPDLSWLPDPDKIYDKQSKELAKNTNFHRDVVNSDSDSNLSSYEEENYNNKKNNRRKVVNSDSDSDDSDDVKIKNEKIHKPSKKLLTSKSSKRKHSQQQEEEDDESVMPTSNKKTKKFASQLSINEAEMLAMKLLDKN